MQVLCEKGPFVFLCASHHPLVLGPVDKTIAPPAARPEAELVPNCLLKVTVETLLSIGYRREMVSAEWPSRRLRRRLRRAGKGIGQFELRRRKVELGKIHLRQRRG